MVKAKIETEEDKNADGDGLWEAAVEIHRLIDPVTITQVPNETTGIAKGRALTESKRVSLLVVPEKRREQRKKRDPAEGRSPERRWPGDGEGQNLKGAREHGQGPEPQGNSSHRR